MRCCWLGSIAAATRAGQAAATEAASAAAAALEGTEGLRRVSLSPLLVAALSLPL